ncbi:MAG: TonB-dependent receptor plug domain-containing protein [Puia sp.]
MSEFLMGNLKCPDFSIPVTCRYRFGSKADSNGIAILTSIPNGLQTISFRYVGYKEKIQTFIFPRTKDTILVLLEPDESELGEVVITSTRSNRTIRNIPTRVEFLGIEELEEKGNMKPGDIRMMLNESTGIQTQQVSATSANSSIRIQGLDGRYTQILKDGFPLYAGFSGGLGLLQTPPLDLKQVEIIKGSTSTLYGGGAIAGMVNLISKSPSLEQELKFLVNVTSAGGLDLNSFYSKQFAKVGMTLYAGYSENNAYDPSNVGFSAIPRFNRFIFNPKLFFNINKTTLLSFGVNLALENRIGGDMQYLSGHGDSVHSYYEENKSQRISTQLI